MSQSLRFVSWGKGELSPIMRGRVDTEHYYASAEKLTNMIVRPAGVPVKRAGTRYIQGIDDPDSGKTTRLIPFVFSVDESYAIEVGEEYFRIYNNDGTANAVDLDLATQYQTLSTLEVEYEEGDLVWNMDGSVKKYYLCIKTHLNTASDAGIDNEDYWWYLDGADDESGDWTIRIAHSYQEDEIYELDYAQKDDVIKFTHQNYPLNELRRYPANRWVWVEDVLTGGPWEDFNTDKDTKIKANSSAVADPLDSGSVTYTANKDVFVDSDVGRYFRIGNINDEANGEEQGYFYIESLDSTDPTTKAYGYNLVVLKNAGSFTSKWSRDAFYEDNYPANVTFHEGRLVLASTPTNPQKMWFSKAFLYNDFNNQAEDNNDGAFDLTPNTEQANDIKWLISGQSLAVGTFGGEFIVPSPREDSLSNKTKSIRRQSGWGSDFVRPVKVGNRIYFVQRGSRKIREYYYEWDNDNYSADDMTKFSEHVTYSGVVDMAYQRNPDSILWCVLDNGDMACMMRNPQDELQAWSTWSTVGDVKSICIIPHPDGEWDRVFLIVERDDNGTDKQYVEYFDSHVIEDDTNQYDDLAFVDSNDGHKLFGRGTPAASVTADIVAGVCTITASSGVFTSSTIGESIGLRNPTTKKLIGYCTIDTFVSTTEVSGPNNGLQDNDSAVAGDWGYGFTSILAAHIGGSEVDVFEDGEYLETLTLSGVGIGTASQPLFNCVYGLPYTATVQTNPLNAQTPMGTAKGKIRRIHQLAVELYRSIGIEYSFDGSTWKPIDIPSWESQTELYTGTIGNINIHGEHDYKGYIYLRQADANAFNLLGIYPQVQIEEKQ